MSSTQFLADAGLLLGATSPSHNNDTDTSGTIDPFFSRRSREELRSIDVVRKAISSPLAEKKDQVDAIVYVLRARGIDLVKVGYTKDEDLSRVQTIMKKCGVDICRIFVTRSFRGAHKVEQIVHQLLQQWNHTRYKCTCEIEGKDSKHTEWFRRPFSQVVAAVEMVYNWVETRGPYDLQKRTLQPIWSNALVQWRQTQNTQEPEEWTDFFLLNARYMNGRELFPKVPSDFNPTVDSTPTGGISRLIVTPEQMRDLKTRRASRSLSGPMRRQTSNPTQATPTKSNNATHSRSTLRVARKERWHEDLTCTEESTSNGGICEHDPSGQPSSSNRLAEAYPRSANTCTQTSVSREIIPQINIHVANNTCAQAEEGDKIEMPQDEEGGDLFDEGLYDIYSFPALPGAFPETADEHPPPPSGPQFLASRSSSDNPSRTTLAFARTSSKAHLRRASSTAVNTWQELSPENRRKSLGSLSRPGSSSSTCN